MEGKSILSTVPILTGKESYKAWSDAIKGVAYFNGFWEHFTISTIVRDVDETHVPATDTTPAHTDRKVVWTNDKDLKKLDMKAQGAILLTVSSTIKLDIDALHEPTAYDMWQALKSKYQTRDGVSALLDYKRFMHAELVDDGTMEAQLGRLHELRARCALNGHVMEDWQYCLKVLTALPDSYSIVQDSLLTNIEVKQLDIAVVCSKIIETELRKKEGATSSASFSLSVLPPTKGKGNKASTSSSSSSTSALAAVKADITCFYCKKKGHKADVCRKKKADKDKERKAKLDQSSSTTGPAKPNAASLNVVASDDEYDASPLCSYFGAPENWLVDSGATDHMTPFGNDITDYVSFVDSDNTRSVVLGNNVTRLRVLGKGTVNRWVEISPNRYHRLILENVLHVEGIKRRFLSTIQFQDRDFVISLEKNRAVFMKDNQRLFSAPRHDRAIECILYTTPPRARYSLNAITELPIKLWHDRMGHLNWEALKRTQSSSSPPIIGIRLDNSEPPHVKCEGCIAGKSKRRSYKSSTSNSRSSTVIERIHSDLMGPMKPQSVVGGYEYVCVFTCDYSRHVWLYLLKEKSQTFSVFKRFHVMIENLTGQKLKFFRSDQGGEYMSIEFINYLEETGIVHETSAPRTPQQNGVAERMNQTLLGGARAMLHHAGMTQGFWSEAINAAVHVLNRAPRKGFDWKTPYELVFGRKPEVSHFRIFGCRAWVIDDKARKWDPRSTPMIFVGYEVASKAYRLWNSKAHKIVVSANVKFDESILPNKPTLPAPTPAASSSHNPPPPQHAPTIEAPWFFVDEEPKPKFVSTDKGKQREHQRSPSPLSSSSSSSSSSTDSDIEPGPTKEQQDDLPPPHPHSPTPPTPPSTPPNQPIPPHTTNAPRRTTRTKQPVAKYVAGTSSLKSAETEGDEETQLQKFEKQYCHLVELYTATSAPNEPKTYEQAIASADASKWKAAMAEEIETLENRGTWEIVDRPANKPVVSSKWVYRMKLNEAGEIVRYKARLVARGFSQTYGVDYTETFAPVTRLETLRMMFALAVENDWEIRQVDVKNAYLYGDLEEEIYMEPPKGMDVPKDKVFLLKKALYGLRQAGRAWYHKLRSVMSKFGLTQVPCEPHLFAVQKVHKQREYTLIIPVYVDDLFLIGNKFLTDQFENHIDRYLDVTVLGNASFFLGIRVTRGRTSAEPYLTIDQHVYAESILTKHSVDRTKTSSCPMSTLGATCLERTEDEPKVTPERIRLYQSYIGSLMYLMLGTRPDIAYAVGRLARFAHDPSKKHFAHVGRVFGYINATIGFSITYWKSGDETELFPYGACDADLGGELASGHRRKSTSGYVFHAAQGAISWSSKLQKTVAVSTMEAEYISLFTASKHAAWTRNVFEAIGVSYNKPLTIGCDNQAAIAVAKGEGTHEAKKHIDLKYHYIQQLVSENKIEVSYIRSENNPADILTKCLTGGPFARCLIINNMTGTRTHSQSLATQSSTSSDPSPPPTSPNPDVSTISVYTDAPSTSS